MCGMHTIYAVFCRSKKKSLIIGGFTSVKFGVRCGFSWSLYRILSMGGVTCSLEY